MKSPQATPEARVKEIEKNVQEEVWRFIAVTLKQGLKRLLEALLEDEITGKVGAQRYKRSPQRQGYRGGRYVRNLSQSLRMTPAAWMPFSISLAALSGKATSFSRTMASTCLHCTTGTQERAHVSRSMPEMSPRISSKTARNSSTGFSVHLKRRLSPCRKCALMSLNLPGLWIRWYASPVERWQWQHERGRWMGKRCVPLVPRNIRQCYDSPYFTQPQGASANQARLGFENGS